MLTIWILSALTGLLDPPEPVWEWPTRSSPSVVRDFDAPESPWGAGHRGLDLLADSSSHLIAPVSGEIWFRGDVVSRGVLTIVTSEGWLVSMEPVSSVLERGTRVRAGERIGEIHSGHCAIRCLHIGLRVEGDYRSPAMELGVWRHSVLLPN